MTIYYLDAGPLQWLIETGQFEQFKAQADALGIELRTTDVVLAELEGRGKNFVPSKEVQEFLDEIEKDPRLTIEADPIAPRVNGPGSELVVPVAGHAGETGINALARNAIDNGSNVKIITHDGPYLRGIGEDLRNNGQTGSLGELNIDKGGSQFPRNPNILDDLFVNDPAGHAEFRDRLRDPQNPRAPFPTEPGRLDFKSNADLGVQQFERRNSDGTFEIRTRLIADGPPEGDGWVDRDTGKAMNQDATDGRNQADQRLNDEARNIVDDPNSYDGNGDMTPGAKNRLNDVVKAAGPLGLAFDLDDALETGKKAREHYKNGDYEAGDRELAGLMGRLNGGLLGARLGAAFGIYGALIGGILGALVGDRALRQVSDWIPGTFGELITRRDPLIVDMSPSLTGVELERLDDVNVSFDLDGDGFRELTGWTGANSGFIVLDHNGNGQIDDGSELFGDLQQNGFDALRAYDSNVDGVFDAADGAFQTIQVWNDANQNGLTEAGELLSLTEAGIVSIDLGAVIQTGRLQSGHEILASSSYTTTEGVQAEAVAVDFSTDQVNTLFVLPDGFEFDPEVFELPNLRGYGEVPDLWVAMTLDPDLKARVQQFMQNLPADLDAMVGQPIFRSFPCVNCTDPVAYWDYDLTEFEEIILHWTGSESAIQQVGEMRANSLGVQDIAESFLNRQIEARFRLDYGTAIRLENADYFDPYKEFFSELAVRFMAQWATIEENRPGIDLLQDMIAARDANGDIPATVLTTLIDQAVDAAIVGRVLPPILAQYSLLEHDLRTDTIGGDIEGFIDIELSAWAFDPADPWAGYDEWEGLVWGEPTRRDLLNVLDPDGTMLDFRRRAYTQNATLPVLRVANYASIVGTLGSDSLVGDVAADRPSFFEGGAGDDVLQGRTANDTFAFSQGFGIDELSDEGGTDEIAFQGELVSTDAHFQLVDGSRTDILIRFEGRSDILTVRDFFDSAGRARFEKVSFADGITVSAYDIRSEVLADLATIDGDVIEGFNVDQVIRGYAGDDELRGGDGRDTFFGGSGDDLLAGGDNEDIYHYRHGDGNDTIEEIINGSTGDRLVLSGIDHSSIALERNGSTVVLVIPESVLGAGNGGTISLATTFDGNYAKGVEFIEFDDGTVWTQHDLRIRHLTDVSTDGDDIIVGFRFGDLIEAGLGNDDISGGDGEDTYVYSRGDGHDTIREEINGSTGDRLLLRGVTQNDITVQRNGVHATLTIAESALGAGDGGSIELTESFNSEYARGVEIIEFEDGSTWSQATLRLMHLSAASTDGDDNITGFKVADTIEAGRGNDIIAGGNGSDTYIYNRGDGDDVINEVINGGTADQLILSDILQHEVSYERSGDTLTIVIAESSPGAGDGGRITLTDNLDERYGNGVDSVVFADQTVMSQGDIRREITASSATDGDDTIIGTGASETLFGGLGNDYIYGEKGNDTYLYKRGDGNDTIVEDNNHSSGDQLVLEDIDPASISLSRSGDHAILTIAESSPGAGDGGQLTLHNTLNGKYGGGINSIVFDDGTVWTQNDLRVRYLAENSTDGDDDITGFRYGDTIEPGLGNDYAFGGDGNDTYIYNRGDGIDTIREDNNTSTGDQLLLRNIDPADVLVGRSGADAVLTIAESFPGAGDGGQLTLLNTIDGRYAGGINSIIFDDGTTWTQTFLRTQYLIDVSTAGDDTITGFDGSDTLIGGPGNDIMRGWEGNDTYFFNLGDGNDVIQDFWGSGSPGSDTILFGAGISQEDLIVSQPNGSDLLLSIDGTSDSILIENTMVDSDYRIEQVEFADGTVLTHADLVSRATLATTGDDTFYGSYNGETIDTGAGNDTVYAGSGNDTLIGGEGDDRLEGHSGNDTIIGGLGDDTLLGGDGDDLYLYARGDGNDGLFDYRRQETDTLRFTDIARNEVVFYSSGYDVYVKVLDSFEGADDGSLIRLYRSTITNSEGIDRIEFSDGVVLTDDTVLTQRFVMGTIGDDVISGGTGNDRLFGDYGNDELTGGFGDDVLNGGYGTDIADYNGLSSEFTIITSGGSFQLRDDVTATGDNEGTDTLIGIETLRFGDGQTMGIASPIILDLAGDGIATFSAAESDARFDLNGDGLADDASWVGPDDAFLFLDRDGNGTMSGVEEISFINDRPNAASDLQGLAAFDSNRDGVIDVSDDRFDDFGVWQDANSNGKVDIGEIAKLSQIGIASISLSGTAVEGATILGEVAIANTGMFSFENGVERQFADAALTYTAALSSVAANSTGVGETFEIDWPIRRGASWHPFDALIAPRERVELRSAPRSLDQIFSVLESRDEAAMTDLFDQLAAEDENARFSRSRRDAAQSDELGTLLPPRSYDPASTYFAMFGPGMSSSFFHHFGSDDFTGLYAQLPEGVGLGTHGAVADEHPEDAHVLDDNDGTLQSHGDEGQRAHVMPDQKIALSVLDDQVQGIGATDSLEVSKKLAMIRQDMAAFGAESHMEHESVRSRTSELYDIFA